MRSKHYIDLGKYGITTCVFVLLLLPVLYVWLRFNEKQADNTQPDDLDNLTADVMLIRAGIPIPAAMPVPHPYRSPFGQLVPSMAAGATTGHAGVVMG
jgi:hypothetical protein